MCTIDPCISITFSLQKFIIRRNGHVPGTKPEPLVERTGSVLHVRVVQTERAELQLCRPR